VLDIIAAALLSLPAQKYLPQPPTLDPPNFITRRNLNRMSGGGESFSSVAKQAADRLTDAVSNFTLYVIGLKKRNAEVPKELVQTVYLIATQCQHLVDMGRQLGHVRPPIYLSISRVACLMRASSPAITEL